MRFPMIQAIYQKEMLDMFRDRRTMISMLVVPIVVLPLVFALMVRFTSRVEENAETEARTLGIAARVTTPSVREALEKAGYPIREKESLRTAVEKKEVSAAVEERKGVIEIYVDSSNPTSSAAGDKIRIALSDLKDQTIRESLRTSGIPESVLTPFIVKRTNIAGERKMAGAIWGTMLGYILLLLMFTGGMYPAIDMTAGEKERHTLEPLLASPASREEIVLGKIFASTTASFLTALLTIASLLVAIQRLGMGQNGEELEKLVSRAAPGPGAMALILLTLLPTALFAASIMIAIALFARSFKEAQSLLTPVIMAVVVPAVVGMLPGLELNVGLALIPVFNVSQLIKEIIIGEYSPINFATAFASNIFYALVAFWISVRIFKTESVLFRS